MVKNRRRNKQRPKLVVQRRPAPRQQQEMTRLGTALRALGGLGGGALGSLVGLSSAGSSVGTGLGAALSRWLGSGDYNVSTNSLVNSFKASGSIPLMHKEDQNVIVRHREFVTEIKSSTDFTVQRVVQLNPGIASSFPWLSTISRNFQQYRIRGMIFHYIPTSSSTGTTGSSALGSVMVQTSYRANDIPPASKAEMMNEYWSCEANPSETFAHPIECNPAENPFNVQYIRALDVPAGDNMLMYDAGATYVATSGQSSNGAPLGDLWVTYEVELKKPLVRSNVVAGDTLVYRAQWSPASTGTWSSSALWDNAKLIAEGGNFTPTFSGRRITFSSSTTGLFLICVRFQFSVPYPTIQLEWSGTCVTSGSVALATFLPGAQNDWETVDASSGGARRQLFYAVTVEKSDGPGYVTLPAPTAFDQNYMVYPAVVIMGTTRRESFGPNYV